MKIKLSTPKKKKMKNKPIKTANSSFERAVERIEPENPDLVSKMWDADRPDTSQKIGRVAKSQTNVKVGLH